MDEELQGYVITEIQANANGTIAALVDTEPVKNNALSMFYMKCGAAAISAVPVHTICITDIWGNKIVDPVTFEHGGAS